MSFSNDNSQIYNQLPISVDFSGEPDLFKNTITDTYKRIANSVNTKEAGLYNLKEQATGQQYFTEGDSQKFRNIYRMTVNFGELPNTTTKSVPHNIDLNDKVAMTRIFGAASDPTNFEYIPIPYVSTTGDHIELNIDSVNVNITTLSDRRDFETTTVVIEYAKTN